MRSMAEIFRSHETLDSAGRHVGGTDKHGPNHRYADAYEKIFPDRDSVKLFLEIGITDGSSMLAWREIFQSALIVGMDIERCSCERGPRLEFHLGDQRLQESCERSASGRQFDVILEDAYHSVDNTLLTLFWLWPFVKPGGMYIIEEFCNIGSCRPNIKAMFPDSEIVDTVGPFGGIEPLVVLRKPK